VIEGAYVLLLYRTSTWVRANSAQRRPRWKRCA